MWASKLSVQLGLRSNWRISMLKVLHGSYTQAICCAQGFSLWELAFVPPLWSYARSIRPSIHPCHPASQPPRPFYLSIYLSVYLSIYLSSYPSIHPSIHPSIYLSIYIYLYPSICIYIYLYLSISIYTYLSISIYIYIYAFPLFLSLSISSNPT